MDLSAFALFIGFRFSPLGSIGRLFVVGFSRKRCFLGDLVLELAFLGCFIFAGKSVGEVFRQVYRYALKSSYGVLMLATLILKEIRLFIGQIVSFLMWAILISKGKLQSIWINELGI